MTDIQWIFFDIGSTLVDEEAAYLHRIQDMIEGTGIPLAEVLEKCAEFFAQGLDGNSMIIPFFGLQKTPWHSEDEILFPEAADTLACLRAKGYSLGIIANQLPGTAARLAHWGILDFFTVVIASAEAGCAKPDPKIFKLALEQAGCLPEEAVMIGDRMDNDILPAKALGMKTILVSSHYRHFSGPQPDHIIKSIDELKYNQNIGINSQSLGGPNAH